MSNFIPMSLISFLLKLLIRGLAVFTASYVTPGVQVASFSVAIVTSIILGVLNAFLRPFLIFLTLPINILTLGLFTLVINTLIIMLTSRLVPEFAVRDFFSALLFGIILALVNWFLSSFV
ncbi:MAG: phage holin family protein [Patescibacteria group bacterium]